MDYHSTNLDDLEPHSLDGISDMDLVARLNESDFSHFDSSDGEELLNALSDDETTDLAIEHFESSGNPPLRQRSHSDPLLTTDFDPDYYFNVDDVPNHNNASVDAVGSRHNNNHNKNSHNSNSNNNNNPFHPDSFNTTFNRPSSDGFANKRRSGKDKPRRKARKNKTRDGGRGTLFNGNGDDDDGISDVASACSAPADLLELGGFNDDPTSAPDSMDVHSIFTTRDNHRNDSGFDNPEVGEDFSPEERGHRRRKSAPLVTDFWGDDGGGGHSSSHNHHANYSHGNHDSNHFQVPGRATIKRRKSDPLISLSDFWNGDRNGGGGGGGNGGGNTGNANFPNPSAMIQNHISNMDQLTSTDELSNIIAVAQEAQDKINRLKALLSGARPPTGGGGGGHQGHFNQFGGDGRGIMGGNQSNFNHGNNGSQPFQQGNFNGYGPGNGSGNGPNSPHRPRMAPGGGKRAPAMGGRSMPNQGFDGQALARSAAEYATLPVPEASKPASKAKSPSSTKKNAAAAEVGKKKRTPKKPSPKNSGKPTPIPKPVADIPIPQIDPADLAKLNPDAVMIKLQDAMERTKDTQKRLQEWDRANGLPKSHSQTMVNSSRSRKQLTDGVILKKWNGTPLIDFEEQQRQEKAASAAAAAAAKRGGRAKAKAVPSSPVMSQGPGLNPKQATFS